MGSHDGLRLDDIEDPKFTNPAHCAGLRTVATHIGYTGPFLVDGFHAGSNPDASAHRSLPCDHGDASMEDVQQLCFESIRRCHVFAAYINRRNLFGTFAELGYARALGKFIWLGLDPDLLKYDNNNDGMGVQHCTEHESDMWFLTQLADVVYRGGIEEAPVELLFQLNPDVRPELKLTSMQFWDLSGKLKYDMLHKRVTPPKDYYWNG